MTTSQRQTVSAPRHSAGHRRPRWRPTASPLLLAAVVVALLAVSGLVLAALLTQEGDGPGSATGTSSATPAGARGSATPRAAAIELEPLPAEVPRMRAVPLAGTVREVAPGTRLVVQELTGSGTWTTFPLRPVVDDEGRFHTYVELGALGVHHLRVVEPHGVTSAPQEVRVR